jgi:predicted lysophospholipase L1 biosynthesis ABC-type transport system permease subunit
MGWDSLFDITYKLCLIAGIPAILVGLSIHDWQKTQRLREAFERAGWAVQREHTIDKTLSVLIWFFCSFAWVVSLSGIALGAWPDPLAGAILAAISVAFFLLRQQTRRS